MKKIEILFGIVRIPVDIAAVLGALLLSYVLRTENIDLIPGVQLLEPATTLPTLPEYLRTFVLLGTVSFVLIAAVLRLYSLVSTRSAWREVGRVFVSALLWLVVIVGWFFLIRKELFYSRMILLHSTVFILLFVLVGRMLVTILQRVLLMYGIGARLALTVGARLPTAAAKNTLLRDVRYMYKGHVKTLQDCKKSHRKQDIDLIIQTDASPNSDNTAALIDYCRSHHIAYAFLPPVFADVPHQLQIDHLGLLPLLRFQPTPLDGWGRVWKAAVDFLLSLALISVLSPLLVVVAIAIIIDDGLPIFFVSKRVGEQRQRRIPVLKFRSMVRNADTLKKKLIQKNHRRDGPLFKMRNDPRITRIGHFLRRWSLDELPQLFNVLAGHMALIGPRPHLPEEVKRYTEYQKRVFAVRPGITGLAQISGRSDLTFEEEVALDLQYIEEWSPLLDLWILWRTVVVVLGRKGAD